MTEELFIDSESLVKKSEWIRRIESIKDTSSTTKGLSGDRSRIIHALEKAVTRRFSSSGKTALLFSGGLDSSLIALILKSKGFDFDCLSAGFIEGNMNLPVDLAYAREISKVYGLKLKEKIYEIEEAEEIFRRASRILPKECADVVTISVAAVVLAAAALGDYDLIYTGGGSEEIFAGYRRHELADDLDEECWKGLKEMYGGDLIRDFALSRYLGVRMAAPFLDPKVISAAMSIDPAEKIKNGYKKYILREAAVDMGLERRFAFRSRKAAQYGSSFDKALAKLSKKRGFKFKRDYISSLYLH